MAMYTRNKKAIFGLVAAFGLGMAISGQTMAGEQGTFDSLAASHQIAPSSFAALCKDPGVHVALPGSDGGDDHFGGRGDDFGHGGDPSPVPEPATWAGLLFGMLLLTPIARARAAKVKSH